MLRTLMRAAAESGAASLVQRAAGGRGVPAGAPRRRRNWPWALLAGPLLAIAALAAVAFLPLLVVATLRHPMVWVLALVWAAYGVERRMAGVALTPSRYAREIRQTARAHRRTALIAAGAGGAVGSLLGYIAGGVAMALEAASALALLVPLGALLVLGRRR